MTKALLISVKMAKGPLASELLFESTKCFLKYITALIASNHYVN